jgi:hypothetical protein
MTPVQIAAACLFATLVAASAPAAAGDVSCAKQQSLRSQKSSTATSMTFVNKTPAARIVMWIDFNGSPQQYSILGPGERFNVDTFMTHPWLITDGPGNCIDIFMPTKKARTVNLTRNPSFGEE